MKHEEIQGKLSKVTEWIQGNNVLQSVSGGLGGAVGIILIGSIFSVLRQLPFEPYQAYLAGTGLIDALNIPVQFTTNFFAVYAVFAIAVGYSRRVGRDGLMPGMLAFFTFIALQPLAVDDAGTKTLDMSYLGAQGLFVAMIVGVLVAMLYDTIMKKGLYIHMPAGVPPDDRAGFCLDHSLFHPGHPGRCHQLPHDGDRLR